MNLRRVDNPPNPYTTEHREWIGPAPAARIEVYEETAGSILSRNDSPDLPFTWSVNPYRGCQHGCIYCYARPYHEYLGFGAGTDFETKLIVKRNAAELLRRSFRDRKWAFERVNFSGVTDCYQPIEASYGITRACLKVCVEHRNPVAVVTKGVLVQRDADVLAELDRCASARVLFSIPFLDADTSKLIEPQAPVPSMRFEAMRKLHDAGVAVGIIVAPLIPGLNDSNVPRLLERAADAGARWACCIPLRLPKSVGEIFPKRLREVLPLRADRIMNRLRDVRGGRVNESQFGRRMRGTGPYWESIRDLFTLSAARYGLTSPREPRPPTATSAKADQLADRQIDFDFGEAASPTAHGA